MGGNFLGYGPSTIACLDLNRKEVDEIVAVDRHDCILPREDQSGNLYFIRKPHADPRGRPMSFIDVLMIPYKIGKGIFRFIEFFTHSFTGETFSTRGTNPAKSRNQDTRGVFIQGNLINVERTLKENERRGEKYPGIAPMSWQLMRRSRVGSMEVVKKGVLDYDLAGDGGIVCSNGKYIIRLNADGTEQKLEKLDMAVKIRVCG